MSNKEDHKHIVVITNKNGMWNFCCSKCNLTVQYSTKYFIKEEAIADWKSMFGE